MYRLVRECLPDMVLVSVGHRATLTRHHGCLLSLKGDGMGGWEVTAAPR